MKKLKTLTIGAGLIAIFVLQSCSNQQKENDWTLDKLKGKVKSFTEFTYEAKESFGEVVKGDRVYYYSIESSYQKVYDKRGYMVEYNEYNDTDFSFKSKTTYTYDENENVIEAITSTEYGKYKWVYQYDNGNLIEGNGYRLNGDSSLIEKKTYKYDDRNNRIEECCYNSDGSLLLKFTYIYDDKNNRIEECEYNFDGSLKEKTTYKYDNMQNLIKKDGYITDKDETYIVTYEYDFEYDYDEKGNWTQKISFYNDVPQVITEREYEYYE